jgi:hypothetical protein
MSEGITNLIQDKTLQNIQILRPERNGTRM